MLSLVEIIVCQKSWFLWLVANSGIGAMFVGGGKTYGVVIRMDTVLFGKLEWQLLNEEETVIK